MSPVWSRLPAPRTGRLCLTVALLMAAPGLAAQSVNEVYPLEPVDGAVTGQRPRFRIGVDGSELLKMRFRIELSRDGFRTVDYLYDGREDRSGWGVVQFDTEEPGALYVVRKPIDGGTYEWRAAAWNGVEWIESEDVFELTIDSVPPARVEQLTLRFDREKESISLQWLPVLYDADGYAENVAGYHVYRSVNPNFATFRSYEIGSVDGTVYDDATALDNGARILYYRVAAEDAAGNRMNWLRFINSELKVDRSAFELRERASSEDESEGDR